MMQNKQEISTAVTSRLMLAFRTLYIDGVIRSRAEFCKALGINAACFARIERGERYCTIENAYRARKHFNVSLDWLFLEMGEMFVTNG